MAAGFGGPAASSHPDLLRALLDQVIEPKAEALGRPIAVAKVRSDVDTEMLRDLLYGVCGP